MYKLIFKEKHVLSNEKYLMHFPVNECLMNTNTTQFYIHLRAIQIIFYIVWIVCMEFESSFLCSLYVVHINSIYIPHAVFPVVMQLTCFFFKTAYELHINYV